MNTLNNENIIYVPNTLDGENIVSSHLEENALLIDGTNQMLANLNAGNHRVIHVNNAISATDAVNKSQLDLKADTTYVDTNFLNKTTTTSQNVAGKLLFNNTTTDILNNPVIKFENNINSSSNGMVLQFKKNLINQPNLQIGGIVWLDIASSGAVRRSCEMIVSNDSTSLPQFEMKMSSGVFNPLTIANTQTILRNDDIYIRTKASQNLLRYVNTTDEWEMFKPLDMNTTNKIINLANGTNPNDVVNKSQLDTKSDTTYVDTNFLNKTTTTTQVMNSVLDMNTTNKIIGLANGTNPNDAVNKSQLDLKADTTYLDTNFLNKTTTSTQDVKGKLVFDDISQDIITFENDIATASNGMRLLFKKNVIANPFLYVGGFTWSDLNSNGTVRRMLEMAVSNDGSTQPVFQMIMNTGTFTPVIINTTRTSLRNKEFYFINNQDSSNILTYLDSTNKIKMYKELDCNNVLVNDNYHLMLGGDPTTTGGMRLVYDANFQANGTAYIDSRATSLIFRLNTTSNPTDNKVVIGNNQTLINSGFAVNGDTIIGNNPLNDACTFNCQGTFPDDSKLTFASGSNLEFNLLSFATFNTGSGLIFNDSAINFNAGAVINGSRVNLRSVSGNYTMSNTNQEGGILCTNTSTTISITMPPKNAYWNNRSYYIKTQTGNVNLVQNTGTSIDNNTGTISVTTDYISYLLGFDDDYVNNGRIWKLATHG